MTGLPTVDFDALSVTDLIPAAREATVESPP